jgi:hypothetical protein
MQCAGPAATRVTSFSAEMGFGSGCAWNRICGAAAHVGTQTYIEGRQL